MPRFLTVMSASAMFLIRCGAAGTTGATALFHLAPEVPDHAADCGGEHQNCGGGAEPVGIALRSGCGGGFFRVFPYWYIRREIRRLNAQGQPAVVYLHPRDIDAEQPRLKLEPVNGFLYHYGLTAAAGKWRRLMSEFTWMPFGGWLEDAAA